MDSVDSFRFGLIAADLENREAPSSAPGVASMPGSCPYRDPSSYPVRPSQFSNSARHLSPHVLQSGPFSSERQASPGFDFNGPCFPPLPHFADCSKSQKTFFSTATSADSAGPPVSLPASSLSPAHGVSADPIRDPPSWASLVKENPSPMHLSFLKPDSSLIEGKVRISLPRAVALKGASIWDNTIVGFFLDKLPFSLVQACAQRHWGMSGLSEVLGNGNGFFFFKFIDSVSLSDVLEGGPWYFGGRPVFLKRWTPGMNLSKDGCKKVPIWVHFYNIPLEYWTEEGLSYIASMIGSPLHADKLTSSLKRLNYARICIEINIDDTLPNEFEIVLDDGSICAIHIEYNWVPKRCSVCNVFGHHPNKCKKVSKQVWVPKSSHSFSDAEEAWKPDDYRCDVANSIPSSSKAQPSPSPKILELPSSYNSSMIPSPAKDLRCSVNLFEKLRSADDSDAINADIPPIVSSDSINDVSAFPVVPSCVGNLSDGPSPGLPSTLAIGHLCSVEKSPVSSPLSLSSSPSLLARKIIMVDEVEKKAGRKKKVKWKSGNAGSSSGIPSINSK